MEITNLKTKNRELQEETENLRRETRELREVVKDLTEEIKDLRTELNGFRDQYESATGKSMALICITGNRFIFFHIPIYTFNPFFLKLKETPEC